MFIKFSDKTKKIIVKTSDDEYDPNDKENLETIDLYENKGDKDDDDRRIPILNDYLKSDKKE
jgi:hypothetical protein